MRTLFLSLLIGVLAVLSGTSGAAVTNRVKLAVAVPVAKAVRPSAEAPQAVPAAATPCQDQPVDPETAITAFVAACSRMSPAEIIAGVVELSARATPEQRITLMVAACSRMSPAEIIASVSELSARATPERRMTMMVAAMQAIAEASRVETPAWYDMRLYDGGTTLWAIASKAKWYAERGDAAKVQSLYDYFIHVMSSVESHATAHTKE